jgi:hypothetical protein
VVTQTAALAFGGAIPAVTGATEEYDGTSWTSNPTSMSTARTDLGGCGTTSSSFRFWWIILPALQQQQKNGQVQDHQ